MALNFSFIRRYRYIDTILYIFRSSMIIMMLGSKGILPHDTNGLLRTLSSRDPSIIIILRIKKKMQVRTNTRTCICLITLIHTNFLVIDCLLRSLY